MKGTQAAMGHRGLPLPACMQTLDADAERFRWFHLTPRSRTPEGRGCGANA